MKNIECSQVNSLRLWLILEKCRLESSKMAVCCDSYLKNADCSQEKHLKVVTYVG